MDASHIGSPRCASGVAPDAAGRARRAARHSGAPAARPRRPAPARRTWIRRVATGVLEAGGLLAAALMLVTIASEPARAHKPVTSKYTYNADVFPIFRDRCGRCHVTDGPAPMSLLNYKDAVPWAESIREEIVGEKMPPWYVDPGSPAIKGGHTISSKEIDTIVTWATGGTPEGDVANRPEPILPAQEWPAGRPDLVVSMPAEYTMPADVQEETHEFMVPTGFASSRWVTLADLMPGTPAIVRDATIAVDNGPVLAAWVPGDRPERAPTRAAFAVPARARLQLRIHYKKPWQDERKPRTDRSAVGLYFADDAAPPTAVDAVLLDAPAVAAGHESRATAGVVGGVAIDSPVLSSAISVVAVRPRLDQPYGDLDVHALLPSGARVPILRLHRPRPEWPRRYWLAAPVELPSGSRVELTATTAPPDPDELTRRPASPFQVAIEFVGLKPPPVFDGKAWFEGKAWLTEARWRQ
jgi:hypothetical protein